MTVTIKDLSKNEELDRKAMAVVQGGMRKLPVRRADPNQPLTTADGGPVQVYVDGVPVNSVATGSAPK